MTGPALYHDVLGEVGTHSRASRDKQRLDSDRGSKEDTMDDSRSLRSELTLFGRFL
jgi:hypothetical protein